LKSNRPLVRYLIGTLTSAGNTYFFEPGIATNGKFYNMTAVQADNLTIDNNARTAISKSDSSGSNNSNRYRGNIR